MSSPDYRALTFWCTLLCVFLLGLTYLTRFNFMLVAPPDKIAAWYPHLGATWLIIRAAVRPFLLVVITGCLLYLIAPFLPTAKESLRGNKKELVPLTIFTGKFILKAFQYAAYTIGAVIILFVTINLISILLIKKNKQYLDYYNGVKKFIVQGAYRPPNSSVVLDSNYVDENILNDVQYTYYVNGEFEYYPALENVHALYTSRHINVLKNPNDLPIRTTLPLICDDKKIIYCFGGSTTFGSLVSDEHTWPAFLMKMYQDSGNCVLVKNYGTCGHNATQATYAFLELLRLGNRPSLAIFMDGVNVGPPFEGSETSMGLAERFAYGGPKFNYLNHLLQELPLFKLLLPDAGYSDSPLQKIDAFRLILASDSNYNTRYANRLSENAILRTKIGEIYNVKVVSFLQPNVFYDYDSTYQSNYFNSSVPHLFFDNYREIYRQVKDSAKFYDVSNLFKEYGYPAAIDGLHYSPDFNRFLAQRISRYYSINDLSDYRFEGNKASSIAFDKNLKF